MHWLFLLAGFGALAFAMLSSSAVWIGIGVLAALGFFVAWMVGMYNTRFVGSQRDEALMIDPEELRRMRELAEARRAEAAANPPPPASVPEPRIHGRAVFDVPDDAPRP